MITVLLGATATPSAGDRVLLSDDEAHHLRVRRAIAEGREVRWTNGAGLQGAAMLVEAERAPAVLIGPVQRVPMPACLMLLVAAGDKERWSWLGEKAAELGVTHLVAVETERSRHVASRLRDTHLPKLEARLREACKQCGSAWAPALHPVVVELGAVPSIIPVGAGRWLADGAGAGSARSADAFVSPIAVLIGPEGGLTEHEHAMLAAARFARLRLGAHVLRFETAALAAAAVISARRAES